MVAARFGGSADYDIAALLDHDPLLAASNRTLTDGVRHDLNLADQALSNDPVCPSGSKWLENPYILHDGQGWLANQEAEYLFLIDYEKRELTMIYKGLCSIQQN